MAKQKPQYLIVFPEKDPSASKPADSTKMATKPSEIATKAVAKL